MNASRWERLSAFSGLVFIAMVAIGLALAPARPDLSSPSGLVAYVTSERTSLLWQAYLSVAAVLLLVWFAGSIRSHLRRNEGEPGRLASISFGGGILFAASFMIITVVNASAAFAPTPESVVLLTQISAVALALGWIPVAVWTGATAIGGLRARALPMWHSLLGLLVAAAALAMPALMFGETGFWSIDRIDASLVMLAALGVWITSTSLLLIIGEAARIEETPKAHEGWHLRRASGM